MGLLDTIKEQDEQHRTTEMLAQLTSALPAVEQQLKKLTATVADLTAFVEMMDEQQDRRLTKLLTSRQPEPLSSLPLDDATNNRLTEIEKTLASVANNLARSEAVVLPDGSPVRRSDLEAHALTHRIEQQLKLTTAASAELAEAVRKRGVIRIDPDRLTEHALRVLDARLAHAVQAPFLRLQSAIEGFEQRVEEIGRRRAVEATARIEQASDRVEEVRQAATSVARRIESLNSRVKWTVIGRVCLALIPVSVALLAVAGLTSATAQAVGVGPILGWAWAEFEAASEWWIKVLIAAGSLGGIALASWVIWRLARQLAGVIRYW